MKKLKVDAALLDLRRMQPAALEGYDAIEMSAAMVLTSPRSQSLLQQYPVQLECAMVQNCEEDVVFNTINGKMTLNGCNDPAGKQILMVNGKLTISPGCRRRAAPVCPHHRQWQGQLPPLSGAGGGQPVHGQWQGGQLPGWCCGAGGQHCKAEQELSAPGRRAALLARKDVHCGGPQAGSRRRWLQRVRVLQRPAPF